MKLARFRWNGEVMYGVVEGDQILSISGNAFQDFATGDPLCRVDEVRFLPPVEPRSIVAVGINYPRRVAQHYSIAPHSARYENPLLFLMPYSSVVGHLDPMVFPALAEHVGAAGELVVVMKREARQVPENEVSDYILGYTCGNDFSSRDLLQADGQQTLRAHGFDTATSFGPVIETGLLPNSLAISLCINGTVASEGNTSDMIYSVETIVSYITQFMTLFPGDIIFMGTPMGAPVRAGDIVEVRIEGIGTLRNEVVKPCPESSQS